MTSKNFKFGNSDAFYINDFDTKNKIIDFLFDSIDLSKYRYNMLSNLQKLEYLKNTEHYVTPNFKGNNYLLLFMIINESKICAAIEKKKLSYHKEQIDVKSLPIYKITVTATSAIFRGTIFDCKLISPMNSKNENNYLMLIQDCFYLMDNKVVDIEMMKKMEYINNIIKTQCNSKCKNFTFKINNFYKYKDLHDLIYNKLKKCEIQNQGLVFYPKYSGITVVYVDKKQTKIDIYNSKTSITNVNNINLNNNVNSSNNTSVNSNVDENIVIDFVDFIKSRVYSYENGTKQKKLWLKSTSIQDVYNIYENINQDKKSGIASIPNLKISHMCRELIDDKLKQFNCVYDNNYKKWIPISQV